MAAATTALTAPAAPLDHSDVLRFSHAMADERMAGLQQTVLDERLAAAQAVMNQIHAIEQAVPPAVGGAATPQFNPIYMQALGFTTADPQWAKAALTLMIRVIYMYSAQFLLSDNQYRTMFRNACEWGTRLHTLYPTVDFGSALPHISATTSTIALGDLSLLHILFAFPILDQLYNVVCREVSTRWVNLGQELLLAGYSPAPTDGNGWACFFAACLQRHLELNVPREVVTDRRAAAQRAGITAGMTSDEIRSWMTAVAPAATPGVASMIVDPRNNAGAQPAGQQGDSLNLLYIYIVTIRASAYEQGRRADSRNELSVVSSSGHRRMCTYGGKVTCRCGYVTTCVCMPVFIYTPVPMFVRSSYREARAHWDVCACFAGRAGA
jgi:hypothetical protein